MTVALKKADGDLFIDEETGRSEVVSGPTKVDQELFSLYTTDYDPSRNWGSKLSLKFFKSFSSFAHLRAAVFGEVSAANERMFFKQGNDPFLDVETEKVRRFLDVNVYVDPSSASVLFMSVAEVGNPATIVGKQLFINYKPISTRHVLPPPTTSSFKG